MYDQMSNGGESNNVYVQHRSSYAAEPAAHAVTFRSQRRVRITQPEHLTWR
jgi:hypothetical protein